MAEVAFGAIGLASSIITFVEFSGKVISRLREYSSDIQETPAVLRDVENQIPLLMNILGRLPVEPGDVSMSIDVEQEISRTVEGCTRQLTTLDELIQKILLTASDSRLQRTRKAFASLGAEKKILGIQRTLETYKSSINIYLSQSLVPSDRVGPSYQLPTTICPPYKSVTLLDVRIF